MCRIGDYARYMGKPIPKKKYFLPRPCRGVDMSDAFVDADTRACVRVSLPEGVEFFRIRITRESNEDAMLPRAVMAKVIREIPTLGYILFGHPCMRSETWCSADKLVCVVTLGEEWNVSREAFLTITSLALGLSKLPSQHSPDRSSVELIVGALGGFDLLERLRDAEHDAAISVSLRYYKTTTVIPISDTRDMYEWRTLQKGTFRLVFIIDELLQHGFQHTSHDKHFLYFRRVRDVS